jgi:membrane protease YdiL (CAAX protease family)
MAISKSSPFQHPQVRWLIAVGLAAGILTALVLELVRTVAQLPLAAEDPLFVPFTYLAMFGGCSLWLTAVYRHQGIALGALLGPLPSPSRVRLGVWLAFAALVFSVGAFQFTYGLLARWMPGYVEAALSQDLFLGGTETPWPWLYNGLMTLVLLVAAPVLEELIFRGAMLHRWGYRWNGPVAVVGSSLLFGILHANWVGLGMFGLVMALLYVQTRSLWLVMGIHALNNGVAVGLDRLGHWFFAETATTVVEFQQGWWLGLLLMAIALPVLIRYIRRVWPLTAQPLPYFINANVNVSGPPIPAVEQKELP